MPPRLVSAPLFTFFVKVLLPIGALAFSAMLTKFYWYGNGHPGFTPPPDALKLLSIPLAATVPLFFLWGVSCVMIVKVGDTSVFLSDYFREVEVPFANIQSVIVESTGSGSRGAPYVRVDFRQPLYLGNHTRFCGTRIRFIPRDSKLVAGVFPIVTELRKLANIDS